MIEEKKVELRKFGLLVGAVFAGIGLFPVLKGKSANLFFLAPGFVMVITGLVNPRLLLPLQSAWMRIGHVLGKVNSFIILSVVFYLVMTPIRFFMSIMRQENKFDFRLKKETYWIKRKREDYRETMKRQF